jgi:bifunctional DNA-binding transcriptional regulator/antitoxin component of YhaV-PrlF toxin-antitoxin module
LQRRAQFYAKIIGLLFLRQGMSGGTLAEASRGARHLSLGVRLTNPTDLDKALKLSEAIALSANSENVLAQRRTGLIIYQFQLAPAFWETYTRADLPTNEAIGLAEKRKPVVFSLEEAPHALVAGATNSGKSEAVKSILIAQLTTCTPDQLALAIIDPDFDYDGFRNCAHLVAPVAQESESFQQILVYLSQELAHRKAHNIKDGKPILIIVDEIQDVIVNKENLTIIQQLAQQGRKYRLHLVAATQKPSHTDLPKVLDNLLNRYIGQVTDSKVSAHITGHAGLECHKLTGRGDFVHVLGASSDRFQVAQATPADFERLERAEVKPVEVETTDLIEIPAELPERRSGRPQLELNPEWLAYYFYHNPDKISRSIAQELGLTRPFHELHKDFCRRFTVAYLKLRQQQKLIGA